VHRRSGAIVNEHDVMKHITDASKKRLASTPVPMLGDAKQANQHLPVGADVAINLEHLHRQRAIVARRTVPAA
jgi:hypothetical protein